MKKITFIFLLSMWMDKMIHAQSTSLASDSSNYLIMKVNDAILDCPHFKGLFGRIESQYNWKEVERNLQFRYLIIAFPKKTDYDMMSKFKEELNNIHFPVNVISDLSIKSTIDEAKKSVGQ